jgi:long-subunit fatty acid transport protein
MRIKSTRYLSILMLVCGSALADESTDGLAMLKNDHIARAAGMGTAVVALGADPSLLPYNPAAAAGLEKFTASFGHSQYWENIRFESGHFGVRIFPRWFMHGGVRYAVDGELEQRDLVPTEEPISIFDAHDFSVKMGVAYDIDSQWSAGLALGWWFEEIEGWRGSALNADLGMRYAYSERLNFGAAAIGLGPALTLTKTNQRGSRDISLPDSYRLGATYQVHKYALAAADVVYADDKAHLHLGAESVIREKFRLRAGYVFGYDSRSYSAGAGFGMRNINVDYAFVPYSNDLGSSHLFNITFSL